MDKQFEKLLEDIHINEYGDPNQIQPPVLAYIGDSIHNLYIRCYLVSKYSLNVNKLHKLSVSYVSAHSQSDTIHKIYDELNEKEQYIIKRGRNAKSGSVPKNADITEYKYATGFESLLGYLFLNNDIRRLMEILEMTVNELGDKNE